MAIIAKGEIVREGRPSDLINDLRGSIWVKTVDRAEVEEYRGRHTVISAQLFAGRTVLHVLSENDPGEGFEPHDPDLQDVYFATLLAHGNALAEAA